MKGYKGMPDDMTCRGFKYEVGKTYETNEPIDLCRCGFHFCKSLVDVFGYYDREDGNRFFEVEAERVIEGNDKCVSSKITIIRELDPIEVNRACYGYGDGYGDGYGNGDGIQKILIFL